MFKKRRLHLCLFLLAILAGILIGYTIIAYPRRNLAFYESSATGPFCGLTSVATICSLKGIETNISTVYRHAGADKKGYTSLANCQRALQELGVPCDAVRFKSARDLPPGVPVLCALRQLKGLHAVVIIRNQDKVLVIDGQISFKESTQWLDRVTAHNGVIPR